MRDDINVNSTLSLQIVSPYINSVEKNIDKLKAEIEKGKFHISLCLTYIYNGFVYAYKEEFVLRDIFRKLLVDLWELVSSFDKENSNVSQKKGGSYVGLLKFNKNTLNDYKNITKENL